jgi:hypothetical protein
VLLLFATSEVVLLFAASAPAGDDAAIRAPASMFKSYVVKASTDILLLITPPLLQIVMPLDKKKAEASNVTLVEVGPRCALRPIKIFEGSFGGRVLYDNPGACAFCMRMLVGGLGSKAGPRLGGLATRVGGAAFTRVYCKGVRPINEFEGSFLAGVCCTTT